MKLKQPLHAAFAATLLAACLASPATGRAQTVGVWNNKDPRDYHGNPPVLDNPYWSHGAETVGDTSYIGNWAASPTRAKAG